MSSNGNFGPSVLLCRLYERVSKNGNHYLTGRLGTAKVVILKSNDTTDDGTPIWNVLLQEAPQKRDNQESGRSSSTDHAQRREPEAARSEDSAAVPQRDWQRPPMPNEEIPF